MKGYLKVGFFRFLQKIYQSKTPIIIISSSKVKQFIKYFSIEIPKLALHKYVYKKFDFSIKLLQNSRIFFIWLFWVNTIYLARVILFTIKEIWAIFWILPQRFSNSFNIIDYDINFSSYLHTNNSSFEHIIFSNLHQSMDKWPTHPVLLYIKPASQLDSAQLSSTQLDSA